MAARTALAKFHPASALTEAFLAGSGCVWLREISTCQPFQVFARLTHGFLLSKVQAVSTKVSVYEQDSATSGFSPILGEAPFGLLKEISRPPLPGLGHLRNPK